MPSPSEIPPYWHSRRGMSRNEVSHGSGPSSLLPNQSPNTWSAHRMHPDVRQRILVVSLPYQSSMKNFSHHRPRLHETIEIFDDSSNNDDSGTEDSKVVQTSVPGAGSQHAGRKRAREMPGLEPSSPVCPVPTDEQLWGNLISPNGLRHHIRSAFQPKRWPAFCAIERFRLPLCYKPGYGLGLVEPVSLQINVGIAIRLIEHLKRIGETRNVLIHCVSFLHQMLLLETLQYAIVVPESFHISDVAPELNDLIKEVTPVRKSPPGQEKERDGSIERSTPLKQSFKD